MATKSSFPMLPVLARSMSSMVGRNSCYSIRQHYVASYPYTVDSSAMNGMYRFHHKQSGPQMSEKELEQQHESQKIAYWSLGVDIFMTTVKGAVGWMLNSTSIIADAAHSLSSMVVDLVTLGCVKICRRPPNKKWVFGYGKIETLSCLAVGGLLIGTAGGVFVHAYELFMAMVHPAPIDPSIIQAGAASAEIAAVAHTGIINNPKYYFLLNSIGVGTVAGTIFIKYWIYLWSNRLAKKYDSNVLYANALHHRADALSSIVALVGLCGRYIGAPWLDPIGGAMVGYTILKAGYDICRDALKEALDLGVDDKTRLKIITAVNNVKSEDFRIEELLARRSGSFIHTIVRICPPQNASLEDIFVNKDKIDMALRNLEGVCIFSVEMVNPYAHHRQLLLGGGAGIHTEIPQEGEKPVVEIIPENSDNDESIIPPEKKDDVEVVITNEIVNPKIGILPEERK